MNQKKEKAVVWIKGNKNQSFIPAKKQNKYESKERKSSSMNKNEEKSVVHTWKEKRKKKSQIIFILL